ncbi:Glutamate receptor [Rhynchospora pubera]|uniref:Glutamate receptor n=1 Tax=Rhynchospora pubera TaxID=906938 RepID=A0AAV8CWQ4_9POAL|nr:Glutamate receptor [Rhynchospora pubera]
MGRSPLLFLLLIYLSLATITKSQTTSTQNITSINIGALYTYNSVIGRAAKLAIEMALEDVNSDPTILPGIKLNLVSQDTKCSGFLATVEALQVLEKNVVAIIGPQSSGGSHILSHVANSLQVPLLSFSATDPTLSSLEFPYFLRATQSDQFQMRAIADIVEFFQWREVTAIYVDDDYGRNGIAALGDELALRRAKISYKAGFGQAADLTEITDLLIRVNLLESRVFVLHVNPDSGLNVFSVAQKLHMTESGYVWIVTDWLAAVLDSKGYGLGYGYESVGANPKVFNLIQGSIVLRWHTPDSDLRLKFVSRWRNKTGNTDSKSGLNAYSLYAYDSVWIVAHAIDQYLKTNGNSVDFSIDPKLHDVNGSTLHLAMLKIFNGGKGLLQDLLSTNFTGVTGQVQFGPSRDLIQPAYDIINVVSTGPRLIGYWSNYSGLSVVSPEILYQKPQNLSGQTRKLYDVVWPGGTAQQPRGWVFPNNGQPLRIGVPNKVSFRQFVSSGSDSESNNNASGFCIDVFNAAIKLLPYPVPCSFVLIGNGTSNPIYDDIINMVAQNKLDAAVGDIAIVKNRTKIVDFTQPYTGAGLVILAPVKHQSSSAWAFLKPFTLPMWCVIGAFFLLVGIVVWILEHRTNEEFRGPPREQLATIFWFSFSTMFFAHRQNTVSVLGRFVLIVWLFVVLIITSSYTASLTSILTIQQLTTGITGLDSLIASHDPIGYQVGKFTKNYLIEELNIPESRLVPLNTIEEYADALMRGPQGGGVTAIVDEKPYVDLFLLTYCDNYRIVGQEFTREGWGFAFQRDSPLAVDLSTAILTLSENGELQRIHDQHLTSNECSAEDTGIGANRLSLSSFWGLFLISGIVCFLALIIYFIMICIQFKKHYKNDSDTREDQATHPENRLQCGKQQPRQLASFSSFKELIEMWNTKEEDIRKKRQNSGEMSRKYSGNGSLTSQHSMD